MAAAYAEPLRPRCVFLTMPAERPGVPGLRSPAGDRLRIEAQARLRAQDDAAIVGPRNRGADNRLAKTGVVPADDHAAVGIVHVDDDVATALGGDEFCLAVGRGAEPEPARRHRRPPTEMPLGSGTVEPADVAHVGETLGGKVHGALTQHPRRGVVNQRVRRTVAKRLRRAIEVGFYRCRRFPPLVAHLFAPPCDFVATGCRFRGHAAIGIILGAFGFFC